MSIESDQIPLNLPENIEFKSEVFVSWRGFHPELPPIDPQHSKPFEVTVHKDADGVFRQGIMRSSDEMPVQLSITKDTRDNFFIKVENGSEFLKTPDVDVTITTQRGGHGPIQTAVGEQLSKMGISTRLFSPTHDILDHEAGITLSPLKYLSEVGYTDKLFMDIDGIIQASLPTDKHSSRSLLSVMALISTNWEMFKQMIHTKVALSDSKAEFGFLASAIKHSGLNPNLKIVQIVYRFWDMPKEVLDVVDRNTVQDRIKRSGLEGWGMPVFLRFMKEKIDALNPNDPDSIVVHMSFNGLSDIEQKATSDGYPNTVAIPILAREMPQIPSTSEARKLLGLDDSQTIILIKMSSSPHPQIQEILERAKEMAKSKSNCKVLVMGQEDQIRPFLPINLPSNIELLGWIPNREKVIAYMAASDMIITPGDTLNSAAEARIVCAQGGSILPIFLKPGEVTENTVNYWKNIPLTSEVTGFNLNKLLTIMMWSETMEERWANILDCVGQDNQLSSLIMDPTDSNSSQRIMDLFNTQRKPLIDMLSERTKKLLTTSPSLLAKIIEQLILGKNIRDIRKLVQCVVNK